MVFDLFHQIQSADSNGNLESWNLFSGIRDYNSYLYWIFTAVSVFGFVNNGFVLCILFERQKLPHLTILKSLAFVDFCDNIVVLYLLNFPENGKAPSGLLGDLLCCIVFSLYLTLALGAISAWHIVVLAVELYGESAGKPDWYKKLFGTKSRTRLTVCCLWILGILIMSNNLVNFYEHGGKCYLTWRHDWYRYFSGVLQVLLILIVPITTIFCSYFLLLLKLVEAKDYNKERSNFDPDYEMRFKAAKLMIRSQSVRTFCLLVVYLVTWLPDMTVWSVYIFRISSADASIFSTWYNQLAQFSPIVNSALNPIIYGWTWFEFRDQAYHKLNLWGRCRTREDNENQLIQVQSATEN